MDGIAREGECTGKIMSQRDKPRLALNNITSGVREREDANRTREAGHLDEIQGVVANTLNGAREVERRRWASRRPNERERMSQVASQWGRWLHRLVRSGVSNAPQRLHGPP